MREPVSVVPGSIHALRPGEEFVFMGYVPQRLQQKQKPRPSCQKRRPSYTVMRPERGRKCPDCGGGIVKAGRCAYCGNDR